MARHRVILRAAVALALLLPAARHANAQDTLIVDSGGARWRSDENRRPAVTVDPGVIDSLPAAARRQYRKPRRYLTLNIPQPHVPPAVAERLKAPAAVPAAKAPVKAQTPPARAEVPAPPAQRKASAAKQPPAAVPAAKAPVKAQTPPVRAEVPEPAAGRKAAAVSAPPSRPAALPARPRPTGKKDATPALQAFLYRAAGNHGPAKGAAPARPEQAKLPPPPRPIEPRAAENADAKAAAPKAGIQARFRLPPPAPATDAPARSAPSGTSAVRLPPPPETGSRGAGVLPPPVKSKAGASATPRRTLALDAVSGTAAASPASQEIRSETFFYEPDGTTLGADERERLHSLALKVSGETGLGVEIRAFSGPDGGNGVEARRAALSRAMEVRRLLIAAGVPDTRILARAAGAGGEPAGRVDVILVRRS